MSEKAKISEENLNIGKDIEIKPFADLSGTESDKKSIPENKTEIPEQPKVTQEQHDLVEKQRNEIIKNLNNSVENIQKFLDENKNKLTKFEKAQIEWTLKAVKDAKAGSIDIDKNEYQVRIVNEKGEVVEDGNKNKIERMEGIPVDGIMEALETVQKYEKGERAEDKEHNEFVREIASANGSLQINPDAISDPEKFLQDRPHLKSKAYQRVSEWLQFNLDNGENADKIEDGKYNQEFQKSQTAEAARQILEQNKDLKEIPYTAPDSEAAKLRQKLEVSSKGYYEYHIDKEAKDLTKEDKEKQRPYTEREAYFVSRPENTEWRAYLEDKYKKEIDDYDNKNPEEKNYLLAELYLRDRKLLVLPDVPEVTPVEEVKNTTEAIQLKDNEALEKVGNQALEKPGINGIEQTIERPKRIESILLINAEDVARSMAWRKAEQELHNFYEQGKFVNKAIKQYWEEAKRVEFFQKALNEIKSSNNLMDAIRGRLAGQSTEQQHNPQLQDYFTILDSVLEQYTESLAKATETGEKFETTLDIAEATSKMVAAHALYDPNNMDPYLQAWRALGPEYGDRSMDPRARVELYVKNEIVPKIGDKREWETPDQNSATQSENPTFFKKLFRRGKVEDNSGNKEALLYASNFWHIAEQYKSQKEIAVKDYLKGVERNLNEEEKIRLEKDFAEHLKGIGNLQIQLGKKERDLYNNKPKGILAWYEKAADWKERRTSWLGKTVASAINPTTFGIAAAVGTWGLMSAARLGGTLIVPALGGAAAAGYMRYLRAQKDLKYDIARERRNETLGGDKSQLLDKKAHMFGRGQEIRYGGFEYNAELSRLAALPQGEQFRQLAPDAQQGILSSVAEIMAAREYEKQAGNQVDLFYDTSGEAAKTGTVLSLRNRLDIELKKWRDQVDPGQVQIAQNRLQSNIERTDKDEASYRRRSAVWSGTKAAIAGVAIGAAAQEGIYMAARHLGFFSGDRSTTLEYIVDKFGKSESLNWLLGRANVVEAGSGTGIISSASGSSATELTDLRREDWHGVGRNFHGKELQQIHNWDSGHKNVTIDVHRMVDNLERNIDRNNDVNWDKTRDPKMWEIMREMRGHKNAGDLQDHIKVRIFPTDENYNNGKGIEVGHIGPDGKLVIDPEMRDYMFDKDGKQLARAIEVGYEDDAGNYHTLNTAVGNGNAELPIGGGEIAGGGTITDMKPAEYDFFVPIVPQYRKTYGRDNKPKQPIARDNKPSGVEPKEGKPVGKDGKPVAAETTPIKTSGVEVNPYLTNSFESYFKEENKKLLGEKWVKVVDSIPEDKKDQVIKRAKKINIDWENTKRLREKEGFAQKFIDFISNISDEDIDIFKSVYIVKESSKKKNEDGKSLVLLENGSLENWRAQVEKQKNILKRLKEKGEENTEDKKEELVKDEEQLDSAEQKEAEIRRPKWVGDNRAWDALMIKTKNNPEGLLKELDDEKLRDKITKILNQKTWSEVDETKMEVLFNDLVKSKEKANSTLEEELIQSIINQIILTPGQDSILNKRFAKYYENVRGNRANNNKGKKNKNKSKEDKQKKGKTSGNEKSKRATV